jgi:hypothetical protein
MTRSSTVLTTAWRAYGWLLRLAPAAALLSLLFVSEGNLRWVGLLGLVALALAVLPGCPGCALARDRCTTSPPPFRPWAGH